MTVLEFRRGVGCPTLTVRVWCGPIHHFPSTEGAIPAKSSCNNVLWVVQRFERRASNPSAQCIRISPLADGFFRSFRGRHVVGSGWTTGVILYIAD